VARGEGVAPLVFLPREAWGAAPEREGGVAHRLEQITLHHTAVAARPGQNMATRLRSYQAHHVSMGWPDIAYHLLIGPDGVIYMGRSARIRGDTATRYDPTGHLLICLDGHFDKHPLPEAQYRAAVGVCAWACRDHRIPVERISPHQAHAETACPGQSVLDRFDSGALHRDVLDAPPPQVRIPSRW
jgi:hypothetical protein